MATRILMLVLDEDRPERALRQARLIEPTTLREVGNSGYGAFDSVPDAIEAAVRDAEQRPERGEWV